MDYTIDNADANVLLTVIQTRFNNVFPAMVCPIRGGVAPAATTAATLKFAGIYKVGNATTATSVFGSTAYFSACIYDFKLLDISANFVSIFS